MLHPILLILATLLAKVACEDIVLFVGGLASWGEEEMLGIP